MVSKKPQVAYSRISVKSQTVLPKQVRERLSVKRGDRLKYIIDEHGVRIEREAERDENDPFIGFSEWASKEDDEAFADL